MKRLLVLLLVSCSSGPRPSVPPVDPAPVAPVVPADYVRARDRLLRLGRAAVDLMIAGDGKGLYARLNGEMRQAISEADLLEQVEQFVAQAPVGPRLGDDVYIDARAQVYFADVSWGSDTLAITIVFDADDLIAGMVAPPRAALPADPRADTPSRVDLTLPFEGDWYVFWGGPTERQNYHVIAPSQRHAYDLVVWRDGGTHTGEGTKVEEYHCWDQPILAPADGKVIAARDGIADNVPGQMNALQITGNHVVLEIAPAEYLYLAHLQEGSVKVKAGDQVERGQLVGRCGNSGNTSEPHLHLHVQDQLEIDARAVGIPIHFVQFWADGVAVDRGAPVRGQFIRGR